MSLFVVVIVCSCLRLFVVFHVVSKQTRDIIQLARGSDSTKCVAHEVQVSVCKLPNPVYQDSDGSESGSIKSSDSVNCNYKDVWGLSSLMVRTAIFAICS